jgi:hypothetical protein
MTNKKKNQRKNLVKKVGRITKPLRDDTKNQIFLSKVGE